MLGAIGAVIMVLFVLAAMFADLIAPFRSAHRSIPRIAWHRPSALHWLGTDSLGRDVWSRIIHGARISLAVGFGSTALGCLDRRHRRPASGYLGGWVDLVFQRIIDILQALPLLVWPWS